MTADDTPNDAHKEEPGAGWSTYRRIFSYTDRIGWALNIVALITAVISGALLPLMNLVFGKTVTTFTDFGSGKISPEQFRSQSTNWTLWFIYLFIGKFCLTYVWTVALNVSALRTTKALRIDFLQHALRQDITFFDQQDNGSIAVQTTTIGNQINIGIAEKLGLGIQGIATFVAAFVVAFAVQWKLTLITLSIVPTMLIVIAICIGVEMKNEAKILDIQGRAGSLADDVFSSIRNVHAFWAQPRLSSKYDKLLQEARHEGRKKKVTYGVMFSIQFFCVSAGYGLAFWQGARMFANGEIAASGSIVTVIFAVIVAATSIAQVAPQTLAITQATSAAHILFKTIDKQPAIDSLSTSGQLPDRCVGEVELHDVEFHYPSRPEASVLKGLSLKLPANKTTALVGSSGSGKSTVVALLERWYDPTAGSITLDGVELGQLNIQWLRTKVRLVQQEPVLFRGTILENVAYGLLGANQHTYSKEERLSLVRQACEAAFAHDFITQLPQGYETEISERGGTLSGGQKQRIAIARSIVSNPAILLLDEATSALDTKAEKIVQQALDKVSKSRTTLIIAHKLSTVQKADNIVVMSKGVIVEQGSHQELLAKNGEYARLVRAQDLHTNRNDDAGDAQNDHEKLKPTLSRSKTKTEDLDPDAITTVSDEVVYDYSLPKCLWYLAKQQHDIWPWLLLVVCISTIGGGVDATLAVLFARAIASFQSPPDQIIDKVSFWALMLFVVAIIVFIVYFTLGWSTVVVSQETSYFHRLQLFKDIMNQDVQFFDREENAVGALASKLSTYPTDLHDLIGFNMALIIIIMVNVLASSILAIAIGWKLGLTISLSALPVMVLFGYLRIRLEFKLDDQVSERFASSGALASEATAAIRTVSTLTLESNVLERYKAKLDGIEMKSIKTTLWTMIWFSASQSISFLAMALGFWYGSRLLSTGEYNSTQFFTVFICVIFAGEGAARFFSYSTSFTKAQKAANYLLWLHDRKPTMRDTSPSRETLEPEKLKSLKVDGADMKCSDLSFSYPLRPGVKVVRDINVEAKPLQSIAFVGPSGCGKTTMISLLERFYDPDFGSICFDDRNIKSINPRHYRSAIALVQQEPTLYQGSIRENIALGKDDSATEAEIHEACTTANIFDFISSLSEGLDTQVGSRGTQLSGGQRQRIAIARALIRQPKLLLLDEATSALDTESERAVQQALQNGGRECTTIAVAHRLSTIKDYDCIFVFSNGKIVEAGSHEQLLQRKGIYHEMCLSQSLDMN